MAWLFGDSFDHYATGNRLQKWNVEYTPSGGNSSAIGSGTGRRSTNSMRWSLSSGNGGRALGKTVAPSGTTAIVGFAYRNSNIGALDSSSFTTFEPNASFSTSSAVILHIRVNNTTQVYFRLTNSGLIQAFRSTTLLGAASVGLTNNTYQYLQFKVSIHSSTGTVEVKIDGATVLNLSGQNTQLSSVTGYSEIVIGRAIVGSGETLVQDYDDLYICDGSGSTHNDFLGDVRGDIVFPNGTGTYNDSTPTGSVTRFENVDENPVDTADYNTLTAAGQKDSFDFPNVPAPNSQIQCVQLNAWSQKTDSGDANIRGMTRISAVDYFTAGSPLASGYLNRVVPFAVDPATSALWANAAFNGAEFGYEKQT